MRKRLISYIPYTISSHENTGRIITSAQFKGGNLLENRNNLVGDEIILDSIDDSSAEDKSDNEYISRNDIEEIWDRKHVPLNINARYARSTIRDQIKKSQSKWTGVKTSAKIMNKYLHKVFKVGFK